MRIQRIEITDRRIRGSNEIAYVTATYKATFSSAEGSPPEQVLGSHLWILRKQSADRVEPLRGSDSGIRRSIAVQFAGMPAGRYRHHARREAIQPGFSAEGRRQSPVAPIFQCSGRA